MANKKDSKTKNSLLRASLAATPLATSVGIGVHNMMREGVVQPRDSSVSKAMATLDRIKSTRSQGAMLEHLEFLRNSANYFRGDGAEVARQAWLQAASSANPLAKSELMMFTKNMQALPAHQVFTAIENTMMAQGSNLAQDVYRKFRYNTAQLMEHHTITGMIPTFMNVEVGKMAPTKGIRMLEPGIQSTIKRIEETLGNKGTTLVDWMSRPGWQEEGLGSYRFAFQTAKGPVKLNVPVATQGILASGATQQTRYIAPDVWVWDQQNKAMSKMKRHEYLLAEFERTIVPEIKSGGLSGMKLERAMGKLNARVVGELENIVNVPADIRTQSLSMYQKIHGEEVELLIKEGDKIRRTTEDELARLVSTNEELFGGTGPTPLSKGRVTRKNLAQLSMVPEATEYSRRPEQGFRKYGLTPEANKAMFTDPTLQRYQRYRKYETQATRELEKTMTRPHLKTMYVDPEQHAKMLEQLAIGDGEALARRGLRDVMQFQAEKTAHLSMIRGDLMAAAKEGNFPEMQPGEIIGTTTEGEYFKYNKNMRLMKAIENRSRSKGEHLSLHYMDTRRLESNDKIFGDAKALVRLKEDISFQRIARRISNNENMLHNLDMIASMNELTKDPGKHTRQIISSLGEIFEGRAAHPPGPATDFMNQPEEIVKLWRKAAGGADYNHKKLVQEAMTFAIKEGDLTPSQFQTVFGANPTVFGKESTSEMVRVATGARAKDFTLGKGIAGGIAKVAYAEPAFLTGAGAMGSLEPRALDILQTGSLGQFGSDLADDFMKRLAYTNPEKVAVHQELTKTLQSMSGKLSPTPISSTWNVAARGYDRGAFQTWLERGGGFIEPGQGMRSIYAPGADTLKSMTPIDIQGKKIVGDLAGSFHEVTQEASKLYAGRGRITGEEYLKSLETVVEDVWKQWAPAGKGTGAVTRGKIIGSRFLRGVSESGGFVSRDPFVAGLTGDYFKQMQKELAESGLYDRKGLAEISTRFEAGEEVGGMIARHPFIGEFSMQPMRFKKIDAPVGRAEIVLPEIGADIAIKGSPGAKRISIGPMVGLAGDKDADIYSAMLLAPDAEAKARQATMALDSEFANRYSQHQVRYQMLKAKKAAGASADMTIREKMVADMRKLGTTQRWVPQLSTELTSAKRALATHGKGMAAADARMLLEWLEQTPISAKHMTASQLKEGGLGALMEEISSSFQLRGKRGAGRLENVVSSIVSADPEAQRLLTSGIELEQESAAELSRIMGRKVDRNIRGANVHKAIKEIFTSMDKFESSGDARVAKRLAGRGSSFKLREIPEVLAKSAASISSTPKGMFAGVSRAATTASNMAGVLGRGIIKNHKTIGFGFAGSIAIAAALSSPEDTVGPGLPMANVRMNMNVTKSSSRMKQQDILPPSQPLGQPTAPMMLQGPRAMISGGSSRQMNVRGRANYPINAGQLSGGISSLAGTSRTTINIRDTRSSLNKHAIANKID